MKRLVIGHWSLVIILAAFVLLAGAYAYVTPALEAPDEVYHYDYIRSLVNTGRPPVLEAGEGRGFGHHAPLYYAYGALASFWVGENDLEEWPQRHNPYFGYRFGDVGRDNKNLYLHPDDDTFGRSDTWLGIRVVRWASVVLGAITVWVVYRVGREVFPDRPEMALAAQADGPPLGGDYPTSLWSSGEIVADGRLISVKNLPPGTYDLRVGMYLLETGERLPAFDANGTRLPTDAIPLTTLERRPELRPEPVEGPIEGVAP